MIGLLQRVSEAKVTVEDEVIGAIGPGLVVLVAVERGDGPAQARRLAERLVSYRVFEDTAGKMNLDVREANGGLLLVPQFTLAADTAQGQSAQLFRRGGTGARPGTVRPAGPRSGTTVPAGGHRPIRRHDGREPRERGPGYDLATGAARRRPATVSQP